MLGLLRAAVCLAPTLNLVLAAIPEIASTGDDTTSHALITLDLGRDSNYGALQQTTLDIRVFESATPCGYGNVTVNGEPLAQDDVGLGSGSITADSGSVLVADWKFTCVHLERDAQVQLLSVHVVSVDGQDVDDTSFSLQFQQIAPVSISFIDGLSAKSKSSLASDSYDTSRPNLEDELAELEMLKKQLLALEHSIALKVTHIADSFGLDRPEELLESVNCEGLKCFFSSLYDRVKSMAGRLYHSTQGEQSPSENQPGAPSWSSDQGRQNPLVEVEDAKDPGSISSPEESAHISGQDKAEGPISITSAGAGQPHSQAFIDGPRVLHLVILVVVVLAIVINLAIMILIFQCVRLLRQRRQARWEKRRHRLRESRAACNALVTSKYMDLIQWLRDGVRRENVEDQEKDTRLRQVREPDSDEESSDTLSITMEEEIAQFRAAADAVGNMVMAEEGRGRGRGRAQLSGQLSLAQLRRASTPSSITSACPTYRTVDESLPAYDEHCSPEYVVDGFQYTRSSSTAGDSSTGDSSAGDSVLEGSTVCSSLDEDMEDKN